MISFLEGRVDTVGVNYLVLNTNGIGYQINIPIYNNLSLKTGDKTKIYTYLYLREDRIMFYGFLTKEEENFFELLISTPGVGPKVGLNILSKMTPGDFSKAILQEDLDSITAIAGIGNKLAKKIVLELKEKISKTTFLGVGLGKTFKSEIINDAIDALKVLGYTYKKAKSAVEKTQEKFKGELTVEELVRESLKIIR
ncbi:Holliday junction branch migration protein RuvA [bacterium]|nr:Holliday junction branch migration protein RuvA [bacterium]MBU1427711.1 Holliday junction branch migration protein RuvA [bacterium]MBU2440610.1 Holliday junction branch migration protein RuvA [bacterium]MBU4561981.1 Holliday junction branch migration protein RuvA [bacterium]